MEYEQYHQSIMRAKTRFLSAGFTLIEVLIVLVIMSIVAAGVTLTIGHNRSWKEKVFVDELMETLSLAEEYAMLQPAIIQVMVKQNQIQFQKLQIDDKHPRGNWIPIDETFLQPLMIPDNEVVRVEMLSLQSSKDETKNEALPILISMNGDWTPFRLLIGSIDDKPHYILTGLQGGGMTLKLTDENESQ